MIRFLKVYSTRSECYEYINVKYVMYFRENHREFRDTRLNNFLTSIWIRDNDYMYLSEYDCETLSRMLNGKE